MPEGQSQNQMLALDTMKTLNSLSIMVSKIVDRAASKAEEGTFDPIRNKDTNAIDIALNNELVDSIILTMIRDKFGI